VNAVGAQSGTLTAAFVLDGVRTMGPAQLGELRTLLQLDGAAAATEDRWLDLRAAAAYLGMHRDTLRKLAAAGAISSEQDGPGCKRYFRKSVLDAWRESGGSFHAASIPSKSAVNTGGSR